jgi:hypothetical protein
LLVAVAVAHITKLVAVVLVGIETHLTQKHLVEIHPLKHR